jgi:hypothetical protein
MARHFRRAFGTSPDRTHALTGCDRDPSNGRAYCRSKVRDKDNSVVAETIRWFQSDDTLACASVRECPLSVVQTCARPSESS